MARPAVARENADRAFHPAPVPRMALNVPARYLGDPPRKVVAMNRNGPLKGEETESGLYPELAGLECRIVEDLGQVPYPLVIEINGWRGIARRSRVEVIR